EHWDRHPAVGAVGVEDGSWYFAEVNAHTEPGPYLQDSCEPHEVAGEPIQPGDHDMIAFVERPQELSSRLAIDQVQLVRDLRVEEVAEQIQFMAFAIGHDDSLLLFRALDPRIGRRTDVSKGS